MTTLTCMPDELVLFVSGEPAPQGSKRHIGNGVMVESSKRLKPWRKLIVAHVLHALGPEAHADDAVCVDLAFVLPRPKATPRRWTPFAIKRPDLDKLVRGVLDALDMASVYADDSRVVELHATKRLAALDEDAGCHIRVTTCQEPRLGSQKPAA